ncbi:hypothetical protein GLOIN_2v1559865 [Rhizophagus irregularis DAOM 181602=DAOM 197198]|uniref:Uncharacterized protein n=1 Tax=Rhizophagus irregularis (strain DAOM 181602 / DAOM 197198 / MUCL 43194) TaxID=747089 RepID=A0A2P4QEM1_RHIID|nr:hypothetical protein GLOIN_2v1559865 [Rhizophagus irregularis DAOM 181602=DAOM 197198]POG76066.1 hypothetical protein GLOIN_2v1559865 [Rhizophagus irregularis DAOM 181602=DAOM 197198]|eukprot:XP_025182932.1 hypothetical protein GLOIN_2v1559865 [Rhizophagus irregularis DAOM 181602=DAOM 197198]
MVFNKILNICRSYVSTCIRVTNTSATLESISANRIIESTKDSSNSGSFLISQRISFHSSTVNCASASRSFKSMIHECMSDSADNILQCSKIISSTHVPDDRIHL